VQLCFPFYLQQHKRFDNSDVSNCEAVVFQDGVDYTPTYATACLHSTRNYTNNKQLLAGTRCFMGDGQNIGESYNNNTFTTTTSLATPETMILALDSRSYYTDLE
jgi:hypothetical protein